MPYTPSGNEQVLVHTPTGPEVHFLKGVLKHDLQAPDSIVAHSTAFVAPLMTF